MLLDTHAWLFASVDDPKRLGRRAGRLIEQGRSRGTLIVSVVSLFEIAALVTAGRLHLERSAESWIRQSIEFGRLRVIDITAAIAIDAGSIPATSLPDPVDRILVATARTLGVPIATRDARILAYITATGAGRALDISK
ncbi:MAG: type II toxin-antitoxin system VapC family toxin [Acidobacteriota bacterium]|nr:type II toxin-antitoxin system VapC family toxin [Acidobacteriota bacterium]